MLTRKGVKFEWSPACQEAFEKLKKKLVEGLFSSLPIQAVSFYSSATLQAAHSAPFFLKPTTSAKSTQLHMPAATSVP